MSGWDRGISDGLQQPVSWASFVSLLQQVQQPATSSLPASAIERLPVEIYIHIFTDVEDLCAWGPQGRLQGRGLATLMLVCRSWRDFVRDTPEFWRRIDAVEPLSILSNFLSRSSRCTIDVRIFDTRNRDYPPSHAAIALVLPHAWRVRSLYVNLQPQDMPLIIPFLDSGLPALQTIEIIPIRDRSFFNDCADLGLSGIKQPFLRSLVLKQVYLPPPAVFWKTLRCLKLYSYPLTTSMTDHMAIEDILLVLRSMPMLEELTLWWYRHVLQSSAPSTYEGPPRQKKITPFLMRHLRMFSVHGPYPLTSQFLLHIKLMEHISYVDIRSTWQYTDTERMFLSPVPTHLRFLLERMTSVSCRPSRDNPTPVFMLVSPPYAPVDQELSTHLTSLAFGHGSVPPSRDVSLGIRCLIDVLSRVPVRRLALSDIPSPAGEDSYERLFDSFPSLEELVISEAVFDLARSANIFAPLSPVEREDGTREVSRCPQLRILCVHAWCIWLQEIREVLQRVMTCVRARAHAAVPITSLVLHFWGARSEEDVREVREDARDILTEIGREVGEFLYEFSRGRCCPQCR